MNRKSHMEKCDFRKQENYVLKKMLIKTLSILKMLIGLFMRYIKKLILD